VSCRVLARCTATLALAILLSGNLYAAAKRSDRLLPASTTGYLSVPDIDRLRDDFNNTQMGRLVNDPVMAEFIDDFKRQMRKDGEGILAKLGVTLDDLQSIVGGEVAMAVVLQDRKDAATLVTVDVSGRQDQARAVLDQIAENLNKRGGKRTSRAGDKIATYEMPRREGQQVGRQVAHFIDGDLLCLGDDPKAVADILKANSEDRSDSLGTVASYREAMTRTAKARVQNEKASHLFWFVEPFGYTEALRILDPPAEKRKGPDILSVLRKQGFTAIQGLGGHITLKTDNHEILHRTFIHAPPVTGRDGKPIDGKYRLAARLLNFPNGENLQPQFWVPRELATYNTWNWDVKTAFASVGTLVDEWMEEEGVWADLLDSLKNDPKGPKLDVEKEIIDNLADRVTVISDYHTPIGPTSERLLWAVEATDPAAVEKAVEKAMKNDPAVRRREIDGFVVWEVTDEVKTDVGELNIEIDGGAVQHADLAEPEPQQQFVKFQPGKSRGKATQKKQPGKGRTAKSREREQRKIQNAAVTVAHGYLFVSSHIDLLERVLKNANAQKGAETSLLTASPDYQRVVKQMNALGGQAISFRLFSRMDEAFRVNYDLLRTNQMPKSESLMGKVLNNFLDDGKPGTVRQRQLDGSKLPDFSEVKQYFGLAGSFITSQDDGWLLTGFTLDKRNGAATSAASRSRRTKE
jgi:hypothetical protein